MHGCDARSLLSPRLITPSSYFACESFYNIAKVCKGEILMYFNEIFDALSKVSEPHAAVRTARR